LGWLTLVVWGIRSLILCPFLGPLPMQHFAFALALYCLDFSERTL
jgi:hypothetical protein